MSYLRQLEPLDEFNRSLQANVHPVDWQNPDRMAVTTWL